MALVTKLNQEFKNKVNIHKPTDCNYFIIEKDGNKYLQLDTYGSANRELTDKVSQSIQLSPTAILQLKKILDREF